MVESGFILEKSIKEATDLMQANKHVECEQLLRDIDEAAEGGTLTNEAGNKILLTHPSMKSLHDSVLYQTELEMKVLFDDFHDMLDKIEGWEQNKTEALVKNDIKMYQNTENNKFNMMATFEIDWNI